MRTAFKLRNFALSVLLICLHTTSIAQPGVTDGFLEKGFYMAPILSDDRSVIAFYEPQANNSYRLAILNLRDFSVRRADLLNIPVQLTPDMQGQYWVECLNNNNYDSSKPNFRVQYSHDGTETNKKTYEGSWYPIALLPDGKMLASDASLKHSTHIMTAKNLRIVDPNTGAEIKNLIPDNLLTRAESMAEGYGHKYSFEVLPGKDIFARINLQTGETRIFNFKGKLLNQYKTDFFVGKREDTLLLGNSMYNPSMGSGRIRAYGFLSGKKLVDTQYVNKIFATGWTFADGRLWAIHENTAGLTEYALNGGPLKDQKVHPLDMTAVSFFSSSAEYQGLIVSKAANRVMLMPRWVTTDNTTPVNEAYIWELSTGKLLHQINNFYKTARRSIPIAAFNKEKAMADEKAYLDKMAAEAKAKAAAGPCGDAKAQLKVKVGSWVREGKDGGIYQLIDYNCNNQRYVAQGRVKSGNNLNASTYNIDLFDVSGDFKTPRYRVVTVRTCNKCEGHGVISGTRNYEVVEYGIYNKYTKTGTIAYKDMCKQCKGEGVLTN